VRKSYFGPLLLVFALVFGVSLFISETYITRVVRDTRIDNLRESLAKQAALISPDLDFRPGENLDGLCRSLKARINARVTLVAWDGKVLGDSDRSASEMENHLRRPEIQQSLLEGAGSAVRLSNTLGYEFLYLAIRRGPAEKPSGFVRLAVPLEAVNQSVELLRNRLLGVLISLLVVTGGFSLWQAFRLRKMVGQMRDFSASLARGELKRRLILDGVGEFGQIANSLNTLAEELRGLISANELENERLNTILRNVPDALLILDTSDNIVLYNAAASDFFDQSLVNRRVTEVVRNPEFFSLLDRVRKTRLPEETAFSLSAEGRERHVIVKVAPFFEDATASNPACVLLFADITRLKQLERMRRDFVANMSHEIKTPITAITGFADTLLEEGVEDRANTVRFLNIIRANSQRINALVDDLMIISRLEQGSVRIRKTEVDLEEVFSRVLPNFEQKARDKGLSLKSSIQPELRNLKADPDRLVQILTNLVDNALKYTSHGTVTAGTGAANGKVFLFVTDTGIGVPEEHLDRLGERFYRVDPARSRAEGGTGLGLAIVKHLVRAHGWRMEFESRSGKGTTVRIHASEPA